MSQSVYIIHLNLSGPRHAGLRHDLKAAQMETARLWNDCANWHRDEREKSRSWPGKSEIHAFTKGRYALHSQAVQRCAFRFLANVEATMTRRRKEPATKKWLKLPWREKSFQPLEWPAQAVKYDAELRKLTLPMGRGRKSLVFRGIDLDPDRIGAVTISWHHPGYQLHIAVPDPMRPEAPGTARATVDLGIIHLATVVDDAGHALVVSGRGIRSIKRHRSKKMRQLARRQSRCQKHSKRWRKIQARKAEISSAARRQVKDLRHKATRKVIDWCVAHGVGDLYVGNPSGVQGGSGRKQNRRTSQWEFGTDIRYLTEKANKAGINCANGDERGTSSYCPECRRRRKVSGREWRCPDCGFKGHRDVVGAVNMHRLAFDMKVTFPRRQDVTYLRPGLMRKHKPASSIRPDTGLDQNPEAFSKPSRSAPTGRKTLREAQASRRVSG